MATAKELKKRISTVKNTQQTTRAMKMVSAAKLRRSQDAIHSNRPYARQIASMMRRVASMSGAPLESPLLMIGKEPKLDKEKRVLLISVTSDRGLCGGFNAQVIKETQRWLESHRGQYASVELGFVGRKANELFKRRGFVPKFYQEFGRKVVFDQAKKISAWVLAEFLEGSFDEVFIVYNEFKNAISQKVVVEPYLPVMEMPSSTASDAGEVTSPDLFIVKPGVKDLFEQLLEKHFAIQIFRILLESQASEHGSRMSAMENATKNAGEMIRKLTLAYNKQRQAGITKELLEIISGSESQKQ